MMRLENLQNNFPKMPEEMRTMIEREVEKQVKTTYMPSQKTGRAVRRTFAASVAAVMLLGTTVFAGVGIARMQREQVGEYGVEVKITNPKKETAQAAAEGGGQTGEPLEIPNVKMEVGYLPEGMVQTEEGKYSFEDALYKGGISIVFYRMDTGDAAFDMLHGDILSSDTLKVNGYDGVYLETPHLLSNDEITFNQQIYVAYTDLHYVMQMYVASDVTKEEAVKIAEGIRLTPTEDTDFVSAWNWSSYLESTKENAEIAMEAEESVSAVSKEEMRNTHAIGEGFYASESGPDLMMKVSDVQISDDISLLDPAIAGDDFKRETDAAGKLLPTTIRYIKTGDLDSLSEEIKTREVAQKLVLATVEYTNTGTEELTDVLFFGNLARIAEEGAMRKMLSGWTYEEPTESDTWTQAVNNGLSSLFEMLYYDVHGGERANNHIASIKPGETITVHMGWVVTEEELGKLYLDLDTYGSAYEFSDTSLATGYVDIRQ